MSIKFIPKSKKEEEAGRNGGDRDGEKRHMQNDQENPSSVAQTGAKEC